MASNQPYQYTDTVDKVFKSLDFSSYMWNLLCRASSICGQLRMNKENLTMWLGF